MFQITILFLYLLAALALAASRFPRHSERARLLVSVALIAGFVGVVIHTRLLYAALFGGASGMSLEIAVSLIGFQLALIGLLGTFESSLRGLSAGLLLLASVMSVVNGSIVSDIAASADIAHVPLSWQMRVHVMTSIFAYGLLTVGAIVAVYALIQDQRLRSRQLSTVNHLFAPLETTERLLYAVTATGFTVLALSVVSGMTFVENLFAQHLVHKTSLSLLALLLFGILLLGRRFAGWRGKRAVSLYLASFVVLSLAYFGSRYVLEEILGRSWS